MPFWQGPDPTLTYLCKETGQRLSDAARMSAGLCIQEVLYDGDARMYHFTAQD